MIGFDLAFAPNDMNCCCFDFVSFICFFYWSWSTRGMSMTKSRPSDPVELLDFIDLMELTSVDLLASSSLRG